MSKAIRIEAYGGPEVMKLVDVDVPAPGPGEVLIEQSACGLNFIDVYMRTGLYALPELPWGLGKEAAGTVQDLGEGVTDLSVGDRVAYVSAPIGAYAEKRVIATEHLVKLPDDISNKTAAAMMLKGLTAQYLLRRTYNVKAGDTILMQAAAGGVGLIVCQWAKHLGATVIGTVGSEEKAELARAHGCDHTILYREENFKDRVKDITGGKGVNVVYDSIGKDTFMDSLDCLKPLGMMVTFGNASGPVEPFSPGILAAKGSLFVTRPSLFAYIAEREDLVSMSNDLFEVVSSGAVKIEIHQEFALADVGEAHTALETRKTTGSTILIP
ncbi:MAG: quinone oxidoreductase [Rhodospirillaceae bacterium]|nr:MAG: quinone oxidoreductase [Rhodospirillaceae bacterium]